MVIFLFAVVLLAQMVELPGFILDSATFGAAPHTVKHLDPAKYLGRWYQVYSSKSVANWFEKGAECVTADYGLGNETGVITVLNAERVDSPRGAPKVIHGFAKTTGVVGQLQVTLETVPVPAPYWILKLGPETFGPNKLYEYSVVSDNLKATLFLLARNTTDFKIKYEADTLKFLEDQGFTTFYNKPVKTYQGPDCLYNKSV